MNLSLVSVTLMIVLVSGCTTSRLSTSTATTTDSKELRVAQAGPIRHPPTPLPPIHDHGGPRPQQPRPTRLPPRMPPNRPLPSHDHHPKPKKVKQARPIPTATPSA